MGDIADDLVDMMVDQHLNGPYLPDLEPDYSVWTTREYERIPVKEMTSQHLYNTIAMLSRSTRPDKQGYIKSMTDELHRRAKSRGL